MSEAPTPGLRFRLGRVPVVIGPGFVLISVFFAWNRADATLIAEWIAVTLVSVLIHELGHAGAFIAFGQSPRIELHQMGGTTFGSSDAAPLVPWKTIAVYAAGPAAGFLFGGCVLLVERLFPEVTASRLGAFAVRDLLWANFGWGALNLLPILPLDGGGVAKGLLTHWRGAAVGSKWALQLSVVTGGLAAALAAQRGWAYPALLAGYLAFHSGQQLLNEDKRARIDRGWTAIGEERLDEAMEIARDLRSASDPWTSGSARRMAAIVHLLRQEGVLAREALGVPTNDLAAADAAVAALMAGDPRGREELAIVVKRHDAAPELAYLLRRIAKMKRVDILEAFIPHLEDLDHPTLHPIESALYYAGRLPEALLVSTEAWSRFSCASGAYNATCALLRLGRTDEAMEMLRKAVGGGFSTVERFDNDTDLEPLRSHPDFVTLRERVLAAKAAGTPSIHG